jgi:hypothetical protein
MPLGDKRQTLRATTLEPSDEAIPQIKDDTVAQRTTAPKAANAPAFGCDGWAPAAFGSAKKACGSAGLGAAGCGTALARGT